MGSGQSLRQAVAKTIPNDRSANRVHFMLNKYTDSKINRFENKMIEE